MTNHPDLAAESAAADGATELCRQIADTLSQVVWIGRADDTSIVSTLIPHLLKAI